jgi:hypothetical protein
LLSINIINWNTRDFLKKCLRSVYESTNITFEIVVVDNNSSDGSAGMVKDEFPEVKLIENVYNLGFTKASNQALKESKGKYILILNPDIKVSDDSIEGLIGFMETHPDCGACGPKLVNPDGTPQISAWGIFPSVTTSIIENFYLYRLFSKTIFVKKYDASLRKDEQPFEVAHLLGACIMIKKEAIEDMGLFDERFEMYIQETDWFYRAKIAGWKAYFLPNLKAVHYGQEGSIKKNPKDCLLKGLNDQFRFYGKYNYSRSKKEIIKILMLIGAFLRIMLWLFRLFRGNPRGRDMIKAYLQVIKELPYT